MLPYTTSRRYQVFAFLAMMTLWMLIVLFPSVPELPLLGSSTRSKGLTDYEERRNRLLTACANLEEEGHSFDLPTSTLSSRLFVDHRHKLMYCGLEKVGCTLWKRILLITTGEVTVKNPYHIPAGIAHRRGLDTVQGRFTKNFSKTFEPYTKVVFAREPYSRLFSAYVDKLFRPNAKYFALRRTIANFIRPTETPSATRCAPFVGFSEFVSYLLTSLKRNELSDGHFTPMYKLCKPCLVKYDIIGKLETFDTDVKYVLEHKLNGLVDLDLDREMFEKDSLTNTIINLFNKRSRIEKCLPFNDALMLSWRAFQLRGILGSDVSVPAKLLSNDSVIGPDDFIAEARQASNKSSLNDKRASKQDAIREAFGKLSLKHIIAYRRLFRPDFELFGYDIEPENIFGNRNTNA